MDEKLKSSLASASEKYADATAARAMVQAIPYVGGSIDTLLAGKGSKIQRQRLEDLLIQLEDRFSKVSVSPAYDEEDLYDIVMMAMENSIRTRATEKRKIYAQIVARHVVDGMGIEESEMAMRIVADLEVVHLRILGMALAAPPCDEPFSGMRIFTISERAARPGGVNQPFLLMDRMPGYPLSVLRNACSELVSKGLLYDEGVGRWDTKAMEYLAPTETAEWLQGWLMDRSASA